MNRGALSLIVPCSGEDGSETFQVKMTLVPFRLPNFMTVVGVGDGTFDVGNFTDEEASAMWDGMKAKWMDHVQTRRVRLKP